MASIYRGYNLKELSPGKWEVRKDGKLLTVALGSEEAAYQWVDNHKKALATSM